MMESRGTDQGRSYDVSSDGQRLYVVTRAAPAIVDRIHVVANWLDELRERIPRPHTGG